MPGVDEIGNRPGGDPETPLTVGILCDIHEGVGGGVNEFSRSLVHSLLQSSPDGIRFVLFVAPGDGTWSPAGERLAVVDVPGEYRPRGYRRWLDRGDRWGGAARAALAADWDQALIRLKYWRRQKALRRALARSPWELDVVHFPYQDFVTTGTPSIFSPWDLQHRHLPELWGRRQAAARDAYYRVGCREACCIALGSEWSRDDIVVQYGIPRSKTAVIPVAPPTRLAEAVSPEFVARVRSRYGLPERFAFYPAATWKHKNHQRLISALARVNAQASDELHLVCCGPCGRNREEILGHARRLGLVDRVHFIGWVSAMEVRSLYRLALLCIYPTLFEGAGLPVLEAFEEGCPLAASAVTCVPEYAGDAALLFDPQEEDAIADAMLALLSSHELRHELAARGKERVKRYSWQAVASAYLSLYRSVAGSGPSARRIGNPARTRR